MNSTFKSTTKLIDEAFDWSCLCCHESDDGYLFSVVFNRFIGRLTKSRLEDRRFIALGSNSQMNLDHFKDIDSIRKSIPAKYSPLLAIDSSIYEPIWSERDDLLRQVLANPLDLDFHRRVLDYLLILKSNQDAELAFQKSIAPYKDLIDEQACAADCFAFESIMFFNMGGVDVGGVSLMREHPKHHTAKIRKELSHRDSQIAWVSIHAPIAERLGLPFDSSIPDDPLLDYYLSIVN